MIVHTTTVELYYDDLFPSFKQNGFTVERLDASLLRGSSNVFGVRTTGLITRVGPHSRCGDETTWNYTQT